MATGQSRENPNITRQIEREKQQRIGKIIFYKNDKRINLDAHREEILMYLKQGVSQRAIAKILGCSPSTLNAWIKRQKP
jgi:DNA invertase Pin-like site-specific DNA recombinase